MKSWILAIAAGLFFVPAVQVGLTAAATDTSGASSSRALQGAVRIHLKGKLQVPGRVGEASSTPPAVGRVAQGFAHSGAKSVIVFVSAGGKEYVATAGARRPKADKRFRVGSVTKTFTATIVLQLVEEGTVRLSDTLGDYLPGVVPRGDEITIRQLLSHRSGLVDFTDYPSWFKRALRSSSTRPIDTLRFAGSKPLAFKPGSQGRYSNTNYIALGLVIEKVTGHSYGQELEQRILEPLGLDHTELPKTRRLPDLDDSGYNPKVPWAAGAIVSNVRDLSRFYSALLSGRILSSASLARMKGTVAPGALPHGQGRAGLGIWPFGLPCGRFWGHGGDILDELVGAQKTLNYGTLVSASEEGDIVMVISVRGLPVGLLPDEMTALLCTESRPADDRLRFTMSGALSDRGRFVDHSERGHHFERGYTVRILFGTKGTIWITFVGRTPNWRITKGTKAYAGLRGRGSEGGAYLPRTIDITMTGTVSK